MNETNTTQEYKTFLEGLKELPLNEFMNKFKEIESFKDREFYLNNFKCEELNKILFKKEFQDIYYLNPQAEYILKVLKLGEIEILKNLVYCYNTNSREFKKNLQEERLRTRLLKEGFKEQDVLNKDDLIKLNGLKVKCVFDRVKIGLLGSYSKKEGHEGKLIYQEEKKRLCFLPKRHTKTGQIIHSKFYYKEVLK